MGIRGSSGERALMRETASASRSDLRRLSVIAETTDMASVSLLLSLSEGSWYESSDTRSLSRVRASDVV